MTEKTFKNTLPATADEIHALLENCLIEEYLKSKGFTMKTLETLPNEEALQLKRDASTYASSKLAEIEIRARFTQNLRDTGRSVES